MSSDTEKHAAEHVDQAIGEVSIDASIETYTPEEQKKIIRRVDRRCKGNEVPQVLCSRCLKYSLAI